jgi:hypothetical protein
MRIKIIIMVFTRRAVLFLTLIATHLSRFIGYCMVLSVIYPTLSWAATTSRFTSTATAITVGAAITCTGSADMQSVPASIPAITGARFFVGTISASCDDPTAKLGVAFINSDSNGYYGLTHFLGSAAGSRGDSCEIKMRTSDGEIKTQPGGAIWGSGTVFLPSTSAPIKLTLSCGYPGGTATLNPGRYSILIAVGNWGTS